LSAVVAAPDCADRRRSGARRSASTCHAWSRSS